MIASQLLTKDEIQYFCKRSNWHALRVVGGTWLSIAAIFAMVAYWTNPLTILLAIALLGGRQLALAIIVHDGGHGSLFTRWSWNRFAAEWLAAPFILSDAKAYRIKHAKHHRLGGTDKDPDLQNYVNYAVERASFRRKVIRDLTGQTGYKTLKFSAKMFGRRTVAFWIAGNAALFLVLFATGNGWLYLLWPAAYFTSHMLIIRIRNAAEHASVPDLMNPDPRKHTRTTYAAWWEKLLFAPNNVNYHLEHHILCSVPCYRLPEFHQYLQDAGHLDQAEICQCYTEVLKKLILPNNTEQSPAPTTT